MLDPVARNYDKENYGESNAIAINEQVRPGAAAALVMAACGIAAVERAAVEIAHTSGTRCVPEVYPLCTRGVPEVSGPGAGAALGVL